MCPLARWLLDLRLVSSSLRAQHPALSRIHAMAAGDFRSCEVLRCKGSGACSKAVVALHSLYLSRGLMILALRRLNVVAMELLCCVTSILVVIWLAENG